MKRKKTSNLMKHEQKYAYLMISPVLLGFLCLLLFPLLYEVYMSCTNMSLNDSGVWIGAENYINLFSDSRYLNAMKNTVVFTLGVVPINVLSALVLAQVLNQKIRGVGVFRTLVFIPYITPVVVWATVWKLILSSDAGILNSFLGIFGITGQNWLFNMDLTMPVVILNVVLKGVGYNVVIFLSALMSVPVVYYEAAEIDGASIFSKFFKVTVPMISPTLFMVVIMTIIGAFKSFANVYNLTKGGPARITQIIVLYIYDKAFREYEFGYAAAASIVLFIIILFLTLIQWAMRKRLVYAEE